MLSGRSTLMQHIIEEQRNFANATGDFTGLLADLVTACKVISMSVSKGALARYPERYDSGQNQTPAEKLKMIAHKILVRVAEYSGRISGLVSEQLEDVHPIPEQFPRGKYLLVFDALDGTSSLDVNSPVGTTFSILRHDRPGESAESADFLQPGLRQVAAAYALYGPTTMLMLTTGNGVNGFTLDREIGEFILTHPNLRIPSKTTNFAIDPTTARFWDPGIKRYVNDCLAGASGPMAKDFDMRWIASLLPEAHRILFRGGVYMSPRTMSDPSKQNNKRLLHEANPIAMIIEQAGGAASTGYHRLLDVVPKNLHQRTGFIFGSSEEVERIERYLRDTEPAHFDAPLFGKRGLFRDRA